MTHNGNIYTADNGKLIVRKDDDFVMGESIDLGSDDNIKNYTERAFTEEEIAQLHKEWGFAETPREQVPSMRGGRK